jgi:predicted adenine nucleotide alpha hydrolase (AANH) superfamily ATPase
VLEYLCKYFKITLLYYNPNISPETEYNARAEELSRLAGAIKGDFEGAEDVTVITVPYDNAPYEALAKGRENLPEGGARCIDCYRLRLEYTAKTAKTEGFDYFCTTLTISPHKNASALNEIGADLAKTYGVPYLFSDFKKNGGYLRSCELSKKYSLYRQNYCGCEASRK